MKLGKEAQTVIRSLILRSGRRISGSQLLQSIDDARGKAICDPSIGASHRSEKDLLRPVHCRVHDPEHGRQFPRVLP